MVLRRRVELYLSLSTIHVPLSVCLPQGLIGWPTLSGVSPTVGWTLSLFVKALEHGSDSTFLYQQQKYPGHVRLIPRTSRSLGGQQTRNTTPTGHEGVV